MTRPLLGVKQTFLAIVQLMPVYESMAQLDFLRARFIFVRAPSFNRTPAPYPVIGWAKLHTSLFERRLEFPESSRRDGAANTRPCTHKSRLVSSGGSMSALRPKADIPQRGLHVC